MWTFSDSQHFLVDVSIFGFFGSCAILLHSSRERSMHILVYDWAFLSLFWLVKIFTVNPELQK